MPDRHPSTLEHARVGRGDLAARTEMAFRLMNDPPSAGSPLVTVVIPCYNLGLFLSEAVESALSQTIGDIEVIVVDDGSTDRHTLGVLAQLRRPLVQVLHRENAGVSTARNIGITRARAKYICCLDADDIIEPTYLEKAVAVMEARSDVGFVYSWVQCFGDTNRLWCTAPFDLDRQVTANHVSSAAVFRRDLWAAAGGYAPSMRQGYEDWEFWLRLGSLGIAGWCLPEALMKWRRHGPSRSLEAIDHHAELVRQLRALNPEVLDPIYRRVVTDTHRPVLTAAPWAWLSPVRRAGDRPRLLWLMSSATGSSTAALVMAALEGACDAYVVITDDQGGLSTAGTGPAGPHVYHLSHLFDPPQRPGFLAAAVEVWGVRTAIVLGDGRAYEAAIRLKAGRPRLALYDVLDGSTDGSVLESAVRDRWFNRHLATADRPATELERHVGPARVIRLHGDDRGDAAPLSARARANLLRTLGLAPV